MDGGRGRRYERGAWSDRDYSQFNYTPANPLAGPRWRIDAMTRAAAISCTIRQAITPPAAMIP